MALAIQPGSRFSRSLLVDRARTIGFMGPPLRAYATPAIVHDLETACRQWLLERLAAAVKAKRDRMGSPR